MSDLPTPHDREEVILNAMATGESIECPEPRTRKEIYLKEIYEQGVTNSLNHTTIGDTEYICSCFKKNESDTYDLSIKPDHTLNSSGKCTVCDKQVVGVAITRGKDLIVSDKKYVKYVYTKELIDYTLVDYGILRSNNGTYSDATSAKEALYYENADGTNVVLKSLKGKSTTVATEDIGYTVYLVGYLRYTDKNGQTHTMYTDVSQARYRVAETTCERIDDEYNPTTQMKYVRFKVCNNVVDYEVIEIGYLMSEIHTSVEDTEELLKIENADGGITVAKLTYTGTQVVTKGRDKGNGICARGYVKYKDENGVEQVKYSPAAGGRFREADINLTRTADTYNPDTQKKYMHYTLSRNVVDYEYVECGIVMSKNGHFTSVEDANNGLSLENVDGTNIIKAKYTVSPAAVNVYYIGNTAYIKGYLIYKDENGTTQTKYTELQYGDYGDGEAPTE